MRKIFTFLTQMTWGIMVFLSLLLVGLPIPAQSIGAQLEQEGEPVGQVVSSVFSQQGPDDPQELEAFIDGVMATQMAAYHVPGAIVVVVKDGEIFFAKGYGYANLENRTPFDPDKSIIQTGSQTKLITDTAVMQLVEQGKLDLDANVNTYLTDFKIPDTFPKPITIRHLLTHTAGFELKIDGYARSAKHIQLLDKWLENNMRGRVRPPGEFAAYTNYVPALAGYIVEQISGMPYEQYIEENIFKPLGMRYSTVRQPIPPELAANMAVGYKYVNGTYQPLKFEYVHIVPSAGMSATATDMAKFMIAHLQDGRYGDTRILEETTAHEMHCRQFTHDPRVSGMAYGFYESLRNNQRILIHRGYMAGFSSILALLPEHNWGFFVAYSCDAYWARYDILPIFIDHYYPVEPSRPTPLPNFQQRVKRFTGRFLPTSAQSVSFQKIVALSFALDVSATQDGTLLTQWRRIRPKQWVEVEPLVFQEVNGQDTMIFHEDDQGRITHLLFNNESPIAFIKLAWHETSRLHLPLLVFSMMLFLSALVVWPISALLKRQNNESRSFPLARWLAGGLSALNLLFLIWMKIVLGNFSQLVYGVSSSLRVLLALPLLIAVLTAIVLIFTLLAWKNGYWRLAGRVHYTLVTVAALIFIWQLNYWNLL